ncbi:MAG: hypothetical protein LBF22_14660 [Deltaproteobacteria bacterium]|nr:hypothetical protein [Deltaproteobacteria bacterium]
MADVGGAEILGRILGRLDGARWGKSEGDFGEGNFAEDGGCLALKLEKSQVIKKPLALKLKKRRVPKCQEIFAYLYFEEDGARR